MMFRMFFLCFRGSLKVTTVCRRQGDGYRRALAGHAVKLQVAAVQLDQLAGDAQAQAGAL